ncbi:MAG: GspE/PulE family protein [Patescibacteria group bacterium]
MSSIDDLLQNNNVSDIDENKSDVVLNVDDKDERKVPMPSTQGSGSQVDFGKEKDEGLEEHFSLAEEKLDEKIKKMKGKKHEDELKIKAQNMGLAYIDLKGIPIPADVLIKIPLDFCKENSVLCFYFVPHGKIRIAISEDVIDLLQNIKSTLPDDFSKLEVEWFLTSKQSFEVGLKQYERVPQVKEPVRGVEISVDDFESMSNEVNSLQDIKEKIKDVSVTELVTLIVAAGIKTEASDIHIEAEVDGIKLRYRIDGVLHTAAVIDKDIWQQMISRIKLLAELKLNITSRPQDGRFSIFLTDDKLDVRLSTLPTAYGESVVMRLLRSKSIGLKFSDLGLTDKWMRMLTKQIKRPNGMIITTGPTGSGKTTTLYAVLNELNSSETKIITVEDPIEYELKGVNQSQVDAKSGYTFDKGLRSIVRQDPDVIMVGEMRDLETVDIALNAALTGHLVLSTLHTNDAAGAVPRFLAMGAKPYLLAPALNLVMAQRLIRKLCEKCKQPTELKPEIAEKVKHLVNDLPEEDKQKIDISQTQFYSATGCSECNDLGYKGRVGIFEMFEMTPEIAQVILSNEVSEYKIRDIAKKDGMFAMVQDGIIKAAQGITSVEEVFRVTE